MKMLAVSILCLASVALADDFKTIDGKEYKNVTGSRAEPDGIVLITKSGISKVYFTELPKEVQDRFHYDAQKAAEFSSQTIEKNRLFLQQREEEEQKRAEERKKYWSEHPMLSITNGRPTLSDAATDQRQPINKSVLIGRIHHVEDGIPLRLTSAAVVGQDRLAPDVEVFLSGSFPGFYDDDLVQTVAVQTGVRDSVPLSSRTTLRKNLRVFDVIQITKLPY